MHDVHIRLALSSVARLQDQLDNVRAELKAALNPPADEPKRVPHYSITWTPGIQFGQFCISGTRIQPEIVADYYLAGESMESVCKDYSIELGQFLVACAWLCKHGPKRFSRLWSQWYDKNFNALWEANYGAVSLPPRTIR